MAQAAVQSSITQEFAERFAGSLAMHQRANQVIPGGITHDGRYMKPFPPAIARAQGAYKWDVDGNRLIDYVMGHGSLLFEPDDISGRWSYAAYGHIHAPSQVGSVEHVRYCGSIERMGASTGSVSR